MLRARAAFCAVAGLHTLNSARHQEDLAVATLYCTRLNLRIPLREWRSVAVACACLCTLFTRQRSPVPVACFSPCAACCLAALCQD